MIAKENLNPPREKTAVASPPAERAGENGKAAAAAASAGTSAAGVAPEGRASSANGARPTYVPARRRSRLNRLL